MSEGLGSGSGGGGGSGGGAYTTYRRTRQVEPNGIERRDQQQVCLQCRKFVRDAVQVYSPGASWVAWVGAIQFPLVSTCWTGRE